jgi:GT2 family glycosyltransferase
VQAPGIDVVIVTADTREMTAACVAEVQSESAIARVVVVDNASSDGTAEALRDRRAPRRAGPRPAARLRRGQQSRHGTRRWRYVCFLNSDILASAGAIAALMQALEADPGARGGRR